LTRRGSARTRSTRCSRHPCHICAGTGLTPATSAPGLRPAPSRPRTRLQVLPTAEESARLCNHAGDDDMPDAEAFLLRLARMAPAKGRLQVRVSSAPSMAGTVRMTCSTLRTCLHPCGQVMRLCCRFHVTLADVSSTLTGLSHACKEINTSKSLPLLMQVLASRAQVLEQMRQGRGPVSVQMWAGAGPVSVDVGRGGSPLHVGGFKSRCRCRQGARQGRTACVLRGTCCGAFSWVALYGV
jgi:hypothetical protein